MTENSAIFDTWHGAGSSHPHRQPAPTAQVCLKHGNGVNWRATRRLSGECRYKALSTRPQQSYRNVSRETFGTIARAEAFQPAVRF